MAWSIEIDRAKEYLLLFEVAKKKGLNLFSLQIARYPGAWGIFVNATIVSKQVTVKTEPGTKTRVDFVSKEKNENIKCTECKSSDTATLTKNQKTAFPELESTGGVVVGKGKPGFPGGTNIPPTKVDIIRP